MNSGINYRKLVNQQLAGAIFQLSLIEREALNLSSLQQSSCQQAALHHLHTTVRDYINEILQSYKYEHIDFAKQTLEQVFKDGVLKDYAVIELNELQQWFDKEDALLRSLVTFTTQRYEQEAKANITNKNTNLIAVASHREINLITDTKALSVLVGELSSLVDRQRESLLEH